MAPEIAQADHAVALENWEEELAQVTSIALVQRLPNEVADKVLKEVAACLNKEKEHRFHQDLNHWEDYAPAFLEKLSRNWDQREKKAAFIAKNYGRALRIAYSITYAWCLADDAVSKTNLEYVSGSLTERYYFLALKRNARDIVKEAKRQRETFISLEGAFGSAIDATGEFDDAQPAGDEANPRYAAVDWDCMDPLEVMIGREEQQEAEREYALAKDLAENSRQHRWIQRRKWWSDLLARERLVQQVGTEMASSID